MDFSLLTYYVMLPLLEYFRQAFGSYGWSIILVTLVIKAVLLPLSVKQMQMSQKMQAQMAQMKPELEKIQEKFNLRKKKYESNPEKLQEVQAEFQQQMTNLYKEHGAMNPLSGCLPTLLQFPILIALYWTFSGPPFQPSIISASVQATNQVQTKSKSAIKYVNSAASNFVDQDGKLIRVQLSSDIPEKLVVGETYNLEVKKVLGEGKLPFVKDHWQLLPKGQNPHTIKNDPDLSSWANGVVELNVDPENPAKATIKALKATDRFTLQYHLNEDRGHQPFLFIKDLGRQGLWNAITKEIHWDICILVLFMGISFWLSNKLMTANNPQPPSLDKAQEEMQKQMQSMMPLMFFGMMAFLPIPAGVFIYFIVSNLIQLAQTVFMQKFMPVKATVPNKDKTNEPVQIG